MIFGTDHPMEATVLLNCCLWYLYTTHGTLPVAFICCSIHNRRVKIIRQARAEGFTQDSIISLPDYRQNTPDKNWSLFCLSIVILRLFFYRIRKFCLPFVVCTFHGAICGCSELIIMPAYICLGKSLVYQVKDLYTR